MPVIYRSEQWNLCSPENDLTWHPTKLNLLNYPILFFFLLFQTVDSKTYTHIKQHTHNTSCPHIHMQTHTQWTLIRIAMGSQWGGRPGEMGAFQDTSRNLPLWYTMDGGAEYECAHVIVCLFVCVSERVNVCVCKAGTFVCTDIYVCTGTLFKSVNGFLFFCFLFLYSYHL